MLFKFKFYMSIIMIALTCQWMSVAMANRSPSVVNFTPATDGGKYNTVYQSQNLSQWGFNVGLTFDYAHEPFDRPDAAGNRLMGVVDDLLMANVHGAIGIMDWWSIGFNAPVTLWQTYYDINTDPALVAKQTFRGKFGDIRAEMKFRILNIDRYNIGLAIIPYVYFPTGYWQSYLGTDTFSPGGKLVVDGNIKDRVFLSANIGYRNYRRVRYLTNFTSGTLNDALTIAGGINVKINDIVAMTGEAWSEHVLSNKFKSKIPNPSEFLVGTKITPQGKAKGLSLSAAGGRAIIKGTGASNWRVLLGINYRHDYVPPPPPAVEIEAQVYEKIIITQKIHFEFDKAVIRSISYPILDDVVVLLNRNPQIKVVRVEGHTDAVGGDSYNQKLSQARAESVRSYLMRKGIAPYRLQAFGYGESRPIADNNSTRGRARNRRTEFSVIQ